MSLVNAPCARCVFCPAPVFPAHSAFPPSAPPSAKSTKLQSRIPLRETRSKRGLRWQTRRGMFLFLSVGLPLVALAVAPVEVLASGNVRASFMTAARRRAATDPEWHGMPPHHAVTLDEFTPPEASAKRMVATIFLRTAERRRQYGFNQM